MIDKESQMVNINGQLCSYFNLCYLWSIKWSPINTGVFTVFRKMSAGSSRMQSVDSGKISVRTRDLRLAMIEMAVVVFFLRPVKQRHGRHDHEVMVTSFRGQQKSWVCPSVEKTTHAVTIRKFSIFPILQRVYRLLWTSFMEDPKDNKQLSFFFGVGGKLLKMVTATSVTWWQLW